MNHLACCRYRGKMDMHIIVLSHPVLITPHSLGSIVVMLEAGWVRLSLASFIRKNVPNLPHPIVFSIYMEVHGIGNPAEINYPCNDAPVLLFMTFILTHCIIFITYVSSTSIQNVFNIISWYIS